MGKIIALKDFRRAAVRRRSAAEKAPVAAPPLAIDDVLSYSGDDLGLEVDETGHLVLVEGVDFE